MVTATPEQTRFFNDIQLCQRMIMNAWHTGDKKLYEELICRYTWPGTGMEFRNGFLVPTCNVYSSESGDLLLREGDVVSNV